MLEIDKLSVSYGTVHALQEVDLEIAGGGSVARRHRTQRRRKVHLARRCFRASPADRGLNPLSRPGHYPPLGRVATAPRHGEVLSAYKHISGSYRPRAALTRRMAPRRRSGLGCHRGHGSRRLSRRESRTNRLWRAASGRCGACADRPAAALAFGRTWCRPFSRGNASSVSACPLLVGERRIAAVVVEHDVDAVFACCGVVTVLDLGRHLATGAPAEIRADQRVITAYLGSAA
jgi:hypothetical protein